MSILNICLVEGQALATSVTLYYTAPALTRTVLKKLTVCNSTVTASSLTVYLVPNGGSPDITNIITAARPVAAGQTYEAYEAENQVLMPGDSLQAFAVNPDLTIMASGIEIV